MRAVAYLRVSSASQVDGHSLDAQDRLFRELCKNRGWEVVKVYREEGRSAHFEAIARRPVFHQLLDDAEKGQFDVVVVHTLDRWSRNQRVMLDSMSILAKANASLVSITENIDYSTPQGKLFTQMLGSFAEYFSGALANHVSKGLDQRAIEGKHTGGIPFGYESCWKGEKGQRKPLCEPEHPGGIHVQVKEGPAVTELFNRYSCGTTTLSQLAAWLNEQGFRTRNMHQLSDANGNLASGPRLFTTASIRGILHNPFYTGKLSHRGKQLPGLHDALVSLELFEIVQTVLKRNSGRSETLQVRPERYYLLKGILRCAYCGMPMWAQTYKSGKPFYREHKASRSHGLCPGGGSITCPVIDRQISSLIEAIELGPRWLEEILTIISQKDEMEKVKKQRQAVQEKLRRMAKAYIDGVFPDDEYYRQKKILEMELESLVIPQANAAEEAGKLILNLPSLWAGANQEERRKLLLTMLDAVYVDAIKTKSIIAIRPKPPFKPVFQVAASREGSDIRILNEPLKGSYVFLVETGESRTPPETRVLCFI
ncbi:recombinase family protein [Chloroflexota bacterium]